MGVREPVWRVSMFGKPDVGGCCADCGDEVLWRISKVSDAPPDIGAEAPAVSATYQQWRKVRTRERDEWFRMLATLYSGRPTGGGETGGDL